MSRYVSAARLFWVFGDSVGNYWAFRFCEHIGSTCRDLSSCSGLQPEE